MDLRIIRDELTRLADPKHAAVSQRFFKTGPGQYGEGDKFIGIRVPILRKLANKYAKASLDTAKHLLTSTIHEERQLALFILMLQYKKGEECDRADIYHFYLQNTRWINNWDLVDASAEHIVGDYLLEKDKSPLYQLAVSDYLWERRIAIVATFCYIKRNCFDDTVQISEMMLKDKNDLIHKATGWMLREIGKRDQSIETIFLNKHYKVMPRTMLRYAIEKYPPPLRRAYLNGDVLQPNHRKSDQPV